MISFKKYIAQNKNLYTKDGYSIIPYISNHSINSSVMGYIHESEDIDHDMVINAGRIHEEDIGAINKYTKTSYPLNASLITIGKPIGDDNKAIHEALHRNMNSIKQPVTLFSGVKHFDPEQLAKTSKDGILHSSAHLSTTTKMSTASFFASPHNDTTHIMAIHAKPGDKMLHVSHVSHFPDEDETVLPSGTRLKYMHTETSSGPDSVKTHHFIIHSQINPSPHINAHMKEGQEVTTHDVRHVFDEGHDASPLSPLYHIVRRQILKHPVLSGDDLEYIHRKISPESNIHDMIMSHPKLPEKLIHKYLETATDSSKSYMLLTNHNIPSHIVKSIYDNTEHHSDIVRKKAFTHPNMPKDAFDRHFYQKSVPTDDIMNALKTSPNITHTHLEHVLDRYGKHYELLKAALLHPKMTPELLDRNHDRSDSFASHVAQNANTPTDILTKIYKKHNDDPYVVSKVLQNPNVSSKHLEEQYHNNQNLRIVIPHVKLPTHLLDHAVNQAIAKSADHIEHVIDNPNLTPEHITQIVKNTSGIGSSVYGTNLKARALLHPKVNHYHLTLAADDPAYSIKKIVVKHPKTNKDTLQRLADQKLDNSFPPQQAEEIRHLATKRLNRIDHGIKIHNPFMKDMFS